MRLLVHRQRLRVRRGHEGWRSDGGRSSHRLMQACHWRGRGGGRSGGSGSCRRCFRHGSRCGRRRWHGCLLVYSGRGAAAAGSQLGQLCARLCQLLLVSDDLHATCHLTHHLFQAAQPLARRVLTQRRHRLQLARHLRDLLHPVLQALKTPAKGAREGLLERVEGMRWAGPRKRGASGCGVGGGAPPSTCQ